MRDNPMEQVDRILFKTITNDIVNGTLLTESDNETLKLVLVGIWEDMETFEASGVIIVRIENSGVRIFNHMSSPTS